MNNKQSIDEDDDPQIGMYGTKRPLILSKEPPAKRPSLSKQNEEIICKAKTNSKAPKSHRPLAGSHQQQLIANELKKQIPETPATAAFKFVDPHKHSGFIYNFYLAEINKIYRCRICKEIVLLNAVESSSNLWVHMKLNHPEVEPQIRGVPKEKQTEVTILSIINKAVAKTPSILKFLSVPNKEQLKQVLKNFSLFFFIFLQLF